MAKKHSEHLPRICRQLSEKLFLAKLVKNRFPKVFKFSENCPNTCQEFPKELIAHEFYQKHFHEFYNFPKFSVNLETILVNVRFQFCLAAESIGQDGAILSNDHQSNCEKAGQDE